MRPKSDELRDFMRVLVAVLGVLCAYWNALGLAPGHPYRHAAQMLRSYARERYGV
jgi:hypothetical protein